MNCEEFEKMINDLACDHLMLANKRAQALAHTEVCGRCGKRLASERLLTERLRLVADAEVAETSVRVKSSLLAAFAARAEAGEFASAPVATNLAPVKLPDGATPVQITPRNYRRWAVAAAAAIIIFLAIVSLRLLKAQSPLDAPQQTPLQVAQEPSSAPQPERTPQNPSKPNSTRPQNNELSVVRKENSGKSQIAGARQNRRSRNGEQILIAANNKEEVTDYIPLTYLSNSTAFDSGMVVRVEVPRSTLISMGLPMNVENANELVKADVVVGDDGVARAIRFVHDLSAKADGKQAK